MKHVTGPSAGMLAELALNREHERAKHKAESQSHYGFTAKTLYQAPFLTPSQVANQLGCSVRTLARWREQGIGPAFTKIGNGRIRYPIVDLDAWTAANTVHPAPSASDDDDGDPVDGSNQ